MIAHLCAKFRRKIKVKQKQVAIETGYSEKTVSAFERGHSNNAILLMWYINHGMPHEYLEGCNMDETEKRTYRNRVKGVRYTNYVRRTANELYTKTTT